MRKAGDWVFRVAVPEAYGGMGRFVSTILV
jgi:hypothetical protein